MSNVSTDTIGTSGADWAPGPRPQAPGPRSHARILIEGARFPLFRFEIAEISSDSNDSELRTQDSGLRTQDSGLRTHGPWPMAQVLGPGPNAPGPGPKVHRFFKTTYCARILIEGTRFPPFGFAIAEISSNSTEDVSFC